MEDSRLGCEGTCRECGQRFAIESGRASVLRVEAVPAAESLRVLSPRGNWRAIKWPMKRRRASLNHPERSPGAPGFGSEPVAGDPASSTRFWWAARGSNPGHPD
jgi:hypothetical protein